MEMSEIEIQVSINGKPEARLTQAYVIGSLAVHKKFHDTIEYDSWCISSIKQGLKFPGETYGLKAAIECAKELEAMNVQWDVYSKEKYPDAGSAAKEILSSWGVLPIDRFLD